MATQIATTPDVLLLAIQTQVQTVTGLPYERVIIDAREDAEADETPGQAEQVIFLRVADGQIDAETVQNHGRTCTVERLVVSARLWTRLITDEINRDDLRITDPSMGHLVIRHQIYDALILFQPTDGAGDWLVSEPIKPRGSQAPRRRKKHPGWARSVLDFTVFYQLALDQARQ